MALVLGYQEVGRRGNGPGPDYMAEDLGEMLGPRLVPRSRNGTQGGHEDHVPNYPQNKTVNSALRDSDLLPLLDQSDKQDCENDGEREMQDKGEPGHRLIGEVDLAEDDIVWNTDLLRKMLRWVDLIASNGARRENVLPTDLNHA